jgi:hypothetical protein
MKKSILILLVAFVALAANAQKYYYAPADDTIKADTNYYPSTSGYDTRNIQEGAFSYTLRHTDIADSLAFVRIQWSNDQETWTSYSGTGSLTSTSTDGQSKVYISTPIVDRYLRVTLGCAAGDTVAIDNQILMLKND